MKIFKFMGKRGFAVFTSLALCASLVAPSFAANFNDLQSAIRHDGEEQRYGDDEAIVAWTSTDENGNQTVNVRLEGDVNRADGEGSVAFDRSSDVILDLNGFTINGSKEDGTPAGRGGAVFDVSGEGASLTIKDSSNEGTGKITGGTISGIWVSNGSVVLEGGTITGNTNSSAGGGGVYVKNNGSFTMNGGVISGNTALKGSGGGVGVNGPNSEFTMNGGEISDNTVVNDGGDGGGGGVWVKSGATFTMNGGTITGNTVEAHNGNGNGGGVAIHQATFVMNGGVIADNESPRGIGVLVNAGSNGGGNASFTMNGGYVKGDDDRSCIYLEETNGKDAVFKLSDDAVMDGSVRLGDGTQIITKDVTQYGGVHVYTGFDIIDAETGETVGSVARDATEAPGGYTAACNALLDIRYDHEWGSEWSSNGAITHSHSCVHCRERQPGSAESHRWDEGEVTTRPTCAAEGVKTYTCADCGATKTGTVERDTGNHVGGTEVRDAREATNGEDGYTGDTYCLGCGTLLEKGEAIHLEPPENPENPEDPGDVIIDDTPVPLAPLPDEVEIDDPEVPLAGLLTRADAIGYLWEKAGRPEAELSAFEDVPKTHQWAVAIGWAQDVGIAVADADGNFRPDDLVLYTVEDIELSPEGELEQFLNRYAVFAGVELEPGELFIKLDGDPDDIVMGEDIAAIFSDFFALLELELGLAEAA